MEQRLGARLLHRSTRGVTLTEVGALYYEKCKLIAREVDEADNLATLLQSKVGGTLRISTSVAFGRRVLVPLVLRYMREHPEVTIDLSFDDRYVNLVGQGVDLAIRMGPMADSTLGARYLGTNLWVMVAAPSYLSERGRPLSAADLPSHDCVVYSSVQGDDRWSLKAATGEKLRFPSGARCARTSSRPFWPQRAPAWGWPCCPGLWRGNRWPMALCYRCSPTTGFPSRKCMRCSRHPSSYPSR